MSSPPISSSASLPASAAAAASSSSSSSPTRRDSRAAELWKTLKENYLRAREKKAEVAEVDLPKMAESCMPGFFQFHPGNSVTVRFAKVIDLNTAVLDFLPKPWPSTLSARTHRQWPGRRRRCRVHAWRCSLPTRDRSATLQCGFRTNSPPRILKKFQKVAGCGLIPARASTSGAGTIGRKPRCDRRFEPKCPAPRRSLRC